MNTPVTTNLPEILRDKIGVRVGTAAGVLSCSPNFIWSLLARGELDRLRIGGATLVTTASIAALVARSSSRSA